MKKDYARHSIDTECTIAKTVKNEFTDKRILVTGGTGSIGATIVRELLPFFPRQIRIYSRDDTKQFELMESLPKGAPVNTLIGDVRDKERLMLAMENIDFVFHAAALKHVASCERNPFETIKTNVLGTQNVIECAFASGVGKVVNISTDKATDPTNILGVTKLLAEKLILSSYFYKGDKKTKFASVRFGNVLWSRGSVFPLFAKKIRRGEAITLTDPSMTRFFMSLKQAAQLVLRATALMQDRETFVFKMPALTMGDAVAALQDLMREEGLAGAVIPVHVIGKKEGERIHEKLLTVEESLNALETDDLYIIRPDFGMSPAKTPTTHYGTARPAAFGEYNSRNARLLSVAEIKLMLAEDGYHRTVA